MILLFTLLMIIVAAGWLAGFRKRIQNRAYHHPESKSAQLWDTALTWLHWGVLLWMLLAYVESSRVGLPTSMTTNQPPLTRGWMNIIWPDQRDHQTAQDQKQLANDERTSLWSTRSQRNP